MAVWLNVSDGLNQSHKSFAVTVTERPNLQQKTNLRPDKTIMIKKHLQTVDHSFEEHVSFNQAGFCLGTSFS